MNIAKCLLALSLLPVPVPVLAQDAPPADQAQTRKEEDGKKMICRSEDRIGTRVQKRKICMTRDEWRQVSTESNMAIEKSTAQLARPGG